MMPDRLDNMERCAHLLPEPGPEVVLELIAELRRYMQAIDDVYNHSDAARSAVIQHFGLSHGSVAMVKPRDITDETFALRRVGYAFPMPVLYPQLREAEFCRLHHSQHKPDELEIVTLRFSVVPRDVVRKLLDGREPTTEETNDTITTNTSPPSV